MDETSEGKMQPGEACLHTWHDGVEVCLLGEKRVCACVCK